jgi:hypothetical protein
MWIYFQEATLEKNVDCKRNTNEVPAVIPKFEKDAYTVFNALLSVYQRQWQTENK